MKVIALFLFFLCLSGLLKAQSRGILMSENDSLLMLSKNVLTATTDSTRIKANDIFLKFFSDALHEHHNAKYSPDSLKMVSSLIPADSSFRIHSWTLPLNNGTYRYYAIAEVFGKDNYRLSELIPKQGNPLSDMKAYSENDWYGALYTGLIVTDWNKHKTYTLLGWDGRDVRSNRKVIDIITITENGAITFGQPVFKTPEGIKQRYILDYAQNATVTLRYDYQTIMMPKGKRIKKVKDWMLVMDELAPLDPRMQGMKEYYVPTGTSYNAFAWMNGYWTFVENIKIGD